jgi:hypothetical protein
MICQRHSTPDTALGPGKLEARRLSGIRRAHYFCGELERQCE